MGQWGSVGESLSLEFRSIRRHGVSSARSPWEVEVQLLPSEQVALLEGPEAGLVALALVLNPLCIWHLACATPTAFLNFSLP